MPKLVLLKNLLQYLTEDDINKLGSTCHAMKTLIFSPMGLKIIVMVRQRNLANYVQKNIIDNVSMSIKNPENRLSLKGNKEEMEKYQKMAMESNKEDQTAELKT